MQIDWNGFEGIIEKLESHPWLGVTYPRLLWNDIALAIWKRLFCPRGWHLLDEYVSPGYDMTIVHGLSCDACEINIVIKD